MDFIFMYFIFLNILYILQISTSVVQGQRAGFQYPRSRVQTRPKPSDFQGKKFLSTPFFRGEVKPSATCRRFAACKRSLNLRGSRNLVQNYRTNFLPTVPPFATRISRVVADVQAAGGESGNVQRRGKAMANYPHELAQDAVCQNHTGHTTGLWFLPARPLRLNINE